MNKLYNNSKPKGKSSWVVVILSIILILLCFVGGIYMGSKFVHSNDNNNEIETPQQIGLPGTINILTKWDNSFKNNLRGAGIDKVITDIKNINEEIIKRDHNILADFADMKLPPLELAHLEKNKNPIDKHKAISNDFSSSLHATSLTYMQAPSNLDSLKIILGAWVYLDNLPAYDHDMRTVLSNKKPGCEGTSDQYGLSMYINSWHTDDHRLYIEYGGQNSGCYKIHSDTVTIASERWYHVAMAFNSHRGSLYIDGELVGTSTEGTELHTVQSTNPLYVGQYGSGEYPLYGNISHLVILKNSPDSDTEVTSIIASMMKPENIELLPNLIAHYPFIDAVNAVPDSKAKEQKNNNVGVYHFPSTGSHVISGVSIPLVDGVNGRPVTADMKTQSDALGHERKTKIKASMKDLWAAYKEYAWGYDELKPLSKRGDNPWGGMGVTLVDSLDTLWIMDLKDEFEDAKSWIKSSLSFSHAETVSVFETTIRELGGLLSAYDLSSDKVFLDKAKELGELLIPAFNTQSGIPRSMVNFQSHTASSGWSGSSAILSELGSLQLEFRYLSHMTKTLSYELKAMKPIKIFHGLHSSNGLFPIKIDISDLRFTENQITFGALGDSFYEYLLKVWLQGGRRENWLREMYDNAMDGAIEKLLQASHVSGLAFLSDWNGGSNTVRKMDHLVCFMPGLLALGAYTDPRGLDSPRAKRDLSVAKALMYTCKEMYSQMSSGISPEYVNFPTSGHKDFDVPNNVHFYILRPETAESLFILNQLTGDPIYREWAWDIWTAIDKHCKSGVGYGSLRNVNSPGEGVDDRMESFFLAETIKYLYLAQDPDMPIDLMKYVFNTEAHPTKILDSSHVPITLGA